jgi:hypothetical protein
MAGVYRAMAWGESSAAYKCNSRNIFFKNNSSCFDKVKIDTYHPASVRFKDNFSSRIFIEHVFGRPQIVEQDRSCSRSNGQNISTKANRSDAYSLSKM